MIFRFVPESSGVFMENPQSRDFSDPNRAVSSFISQRGALNDMISNDLDNVANKLYAQNIIPQGIHSKASYKMHDPTTRTMALLGAVESKIRVEPSAFSKFISILESEPYFQSLADSLVESYRKCQIIVVESDKNLMQSYIL